MFPELVRFTWQAEDQSGRKVELEDTEQLEQIDDDPDVRITSMLIVNKEKVRTNIFTCLVQHDSSVDDQSVIVPRVKDVTMTQTCSVPKIGEEEEEKFMTSGVLEFSRSLYLFSVTYLILLVKNVLYFCTISVLLCKTNAAIPT
ncbi:hypothetical protein KOW79_006146 [Hemibagrus wyckioides]|uniref:Ig-like domain-containing protein n=1 Tax=Hemibagrus wyckioides TaxID=337641 RepID=A0A9D3NXB4_9TELE|nr:hypothetical protein KOW79_006146 [Hemibagrus wyckioides]